MSDTVFTRTQVADFVHAHTTSMLPYFKELHYTSKGITEAMMIDDIFLAQTVPPTWKNNNKFHMNHKTVHGLIFQLRSADELSKKEIAIRYAIETHNKCFIPPIHQPRKPFNGWGRL